MPAASGLITVNCTIAAGQSLSSAADLSAGTPRYVITPPDWNYAAGLSIQLSIDGTNFFDVFLPNGHEHIVGPVTANAIYPMEANVAQYAAAMKIRSGSRDNPVVQKSARTFKIILE